ncbi:hypothetical protein L218DRAFT_958274, partial [Marasmius fiardii PR-910]
MDIGLLVTLFDITVLLHPFKLNPISVLANNWNSRGESVLLQQRNAVRVPAATLRLDLIFFTCYWQPR